MNIQFLEGIYQILIPECREGFIRKGFAFLKKRGQDKGFRQTSWWNSSLCKQRLCSLINSNPNILKELLPPCDFNFFSKVFPTFSEECKKFSEFFVKNYGAPQITPALVENDFEEALITNEFDAWLKEYLFKNQAPNEKFLEMFPVDFIPFYLMKLVKNGYRYSFDEFCNYLWKNIAWFAVLLRTNLDLYFPIPEDVKEGLIHNLSYKMNATSLNNATKVQEDVVKLTNDDWLLSREVYELAQTFKNTASPESCLAVADALTQHGCYAAAENFYLQLVKLAKPKDTATVAKQYLLALARAEGDSERLKEEFQSFAAVKGDSPGLVQLREEIRECCAAHAKDRTRRFVEWAQRIDFYNQPKLTQDKLFNSEVNTLLREHKLDALEFLLEGLNSPVWGSDETRTGVLIMLWQAQQVWHLTVKLTGTLNRIKNKSVNPSAREHAWAEIVRCLIAENRLVEADKEIGKMREAFVDSRRISTLENSLQAARRNDMEICAAGSDKNDKSIEVPVQSSVSEKSYATPMAYSSEEDLPYPRRYLGVVDHVSGHINYSAKYVLTRRGWKALTREDQVRLFPNRGWLSLVFANPALTRPFKAGHFMVLDIDFGDLRPTADTVYTLSIEPQLGRQMHFLSKIGAVVVVPEERNFDLTTDTYVRVSDDDQDNSVYDGEDAVIETKEGFIGPFRLRADVNRRLYIPRVSPAEVGAATLWVPSFADSVIYLAADTQENMAHCRLALISEEKSFSKKTVDLLTDAALLQVASREIPAIPAFTNIGQVLETSDLLTSEDRRAKIIKLLSDFSSVYRFTGEVKQTAVKSVVAALREESSRKSRPVTDAVVTAVTESPELTELSRQLTEERRTLVARHRAVLAEEQERFEAQKTALGARLTELQQRVSQTEQEGIAKKAFWEEEIRKVVENAKTEFVRFKALPFLDTVVSNKIGEEESEPTDNDRKDNVDYAGRAASFQALPTQQGSASSIRQILIKAFQERRCYDHDQVVNLFISVALNFLTVFSGAPGCGKTSACGILAEVLGLKGMKPRLKEASAWTDAGNYDRYLTVQVERGWTSKRDFLGYFNPLTQSFSTNDRRRYDAFRLLDKEVELQKNIPFLLLMDEANLSPMEYYWADFMAICGGDENTAHEIMLGDNRLCRIPDHLRFLATINIDDTTEPLSPRLLDRAWIVRLPDPAFVVTKKVQTEMTPVLWKDFQLAFGGGYNAQEVDEMKPFLEALHALGMNVSFRSRQAMAQFVAVGTPLFNGKRRTAVDYAVAQKLLPMIRGSGAAFRTKLEGLQEVCKNYPVSSEILTQILQRGDQNLNFYQFF